MGLPIRALLASAALISATPALAAPTDLSTWTREGDGTWNVAADKNSVTQTVNGNPVVFYSDFNALGRKLSGTVEVETFSDDDFIGFVVGFNPGDLTSSSSNFVVIDWKQINQGSFGCNADVGLALSTATAGLANNAGAWCHQGFGVTELARGDTLGATGWADHTKYTFDIEYTATNIKVAVNGIKQFDINGTFTDGRFGFYNYSQATVTYAGITDVVLPPVIPPGPGAVPEPGSWALMITGFGGMGAMLRRRRRLVMA